MNLCATDLCLTVDGVDHLRNVTATFEPGRLHTVIGRTMAGKTTLLRVLAGLEKADSGSLTRAGADFLKTPVWRRDTAMVYQQFINYPHLNVFDNVAFPLKRAGLPRDEIRRRVRQSLARVGLADFEKRKPSQLSGGQQQRVAMARALARATGILLLDEPLANLDYKLREQLRDEFRTLFSDRGDTIVVYTTTEPAEAMMLGDVVLVMHEGRILQTGTPQEVFERPATTTVASIINDPPMNIFPGRIESGRVVAAGLQAVPAPGHLADLPDGSYQFGLRATDVGLAAGGAERGVEGEAVFVEISGSETFVHVAVGETPFVVQIEGIHDVGLGDLVELHLRDARLFAFDERGALVRTPSYELTPVEGR
ncbi:ABC transporter ATP-binding protein [Streptomyces sp. PKU-MA01144]|uniref:ABC transporter ATP-binding protein n=1 Tax=Streptomyces TaxID=1883 RepID=UPI00147DCF89|nr:MULTISPECIES: ABC transporter ATP-binding protein [Streptomyces]MCY0982055.1 ABC transporter ATP-binding protein [Streptomyces tirandamycinicus]NNJ04440.1 ABC transporter ATP-binding protein [Streptomyces sp. PKU-MA01144]